MFLSMSLPYVRKPLSLGKLLPDGIPSEINSDLCGVSNVHWIEIVFVVVKYHAISSFVFKGDATVYFFFEVPSCNRYSVVRTYHLYKY